GGDRGARPEMGRAAAGGGRRARRRRRVGRRAARAPRAGLREVVATRSLRVRGRDPQDRGRQVPQDRAARAVREAAGGDAVRIEGKTFLVTGGKSGLGEATAALLEASGAHVEILDLPETDVTDEAAVRERVTACAELHGVVNCAGIGAGARVVSFDLELFRKVVDVNLVGTFTVVRHAAERMAANEP